MKNYNYNDIKNQGVIGEIIQQEKGSVWKIIIKEKDKYTFWLFTWTNGIADFIVKNMKKRGETIPAKHWEWRHVEAVKTLKEAKKLFNS